MHTPVIMYLHAHEGESGKSEFPWFTPLLAKWGECDWGPTKAAAGEVSYQNGSEGWVENKNPWHSSENANSAGIFCPLFIPRFELFFSPSEIINSCDAMSLLVAASTKCSAPLTPIRVSLGNQWLFIVDFNAGEEWLDRVTFLKCL